MSVDSIVDTNTNFYSPTKLVSFINDTYKNNKFVKAVIYFEGEKVFKNKFDKYCCKPLFITLESNNKKNNVFINYNKIIKLFGDSIIVSFNCKFDSKDKLYVLIIELTMQTYMDTPYYPCHVLECVNKHNIKCIRDQFKIEFDDSDIKDDCFV